MKHCITEKSHPALYRLIVAQREDDTQSTIDAEVARRNQQENS